MQHIKSHDGKHNFSQVGSHLPALETFGLLIGAGGGLGLGLGRAACGRGGGGGGLLGGGRGLGGGGGGGGGAISGIGSPFSII